MLPVQIGNRYAVSFLSLFSPSSLCSFSHYCDAEEQLPGLTMTSSLPVYFFLLQTHG